MFYKTNMVNFAKKFKKIREKKTIYSNFGKYSLLLELNLKYIL